MKIKNILEDVGSTPIVRLGNLFPKANVWMKLEKNDTGERYLNASILLKEIKSHKKNQVSYFMRFNLLYYLRQDFLYLIH